MRDPLLQAAREKAIKDDYAKLASQRIYSRTYIIDKLSQQYYLKCNTIERIVWGEYDTRRRLKEERARQLGAAA